MAIAHDSDWGIAGSSAVTTQAIGPHTPVAGTSLIVVYATVSGGVTLSSVTDSSSNSYTVIPTNYTTAGGNHGYLAYSVVPTVASITITGHLSASGNIVIAASAFTGTATTSPFDTAISGIGGPSGNLDSGATATTRFANELLVGVGGLDSGSSTSAWTVGGVQDSGIGYTSAGAFNGSPIDSICQWQIVSTTGAYHCTATNTSNTTHNWGMLVATFADTPVPSSSGTIGNPMSDINRLTQPFLPAYMGAASCVTLTAATTAVSAQLPFQSTGGSFSQIEGQPHALELYNSSTTQAAFMAFGNSSANAITNATVPGGSAGGFILPPGFRRVVSIPPNASWIAGITAATTAVIYATIGDGS